MVGRYHGALVRVAHCAPVSGRWVIVCTRYHRVGWVDEYLTGFDCFGAALWGPLDSAEVWDTEREAQAEIEVSGLTGVTTERIGSVDDE